MLAEILHKVAGMEQENWEYTPRPSSNDRCIRALTYHALKVAPKPFPGRTLHVFNDGHFHETLTGDWINQTAYRLHSDQMEVACYEVAGKMQSGHIDGIITDLIGVDRLWEHKAINTYSFERVWNGERPMGYIGQCCCYLRGLQQAGFTEITEALLLFKNKNTAQYVEILLSYDSATDICRLISMTRSTGEVKDINEEIPRVIQGIVDKFEMVEHYRFHNSLPERPYTFADSTGFPCSYCGWGEACWGEYIKEFEKLETAADLDKDLEDLAAYYLETNGHLEGMQTEKEVLRSQIIKALKEKGVSGGKAGPYTIVLSMMQRKTVDKTKIPPAILAEAQESKTTERLSIRKVKEDVS